MCRFISPDNVDLLGANGDFASLNLFAYCGNNPVSREDASGQLWLNILAGAIVNVTTTFLAAKVTGQQYTWRDAAFAALAGGVNAIPLCGPWLSGLITGGYTAYMSYQNGASLTGAILTGGFAGFCSTMSISNLASFQGDVLDLGTTVFVDIVFGSANNSMAAATYKAVTDGTSQKTKSVTNVISTPKRTYGKGIINRGNFSSVRGLTI